MLQLGKIIFGLRERIQAPWERKSQTKVEKKEMLFKNDARIESDICLEENRTNLPRALPSVRH